MCVSCLFISIQQNKCGVGRRQAGATMVRYRSYYTARKPGLARGLFGFLNKTHKIARPFIPRWKVDWMAGGPLVVMYIGHEERGASWGKGGNNTRYDMRDMARSFLLFSTARSLSLYTHALMTPLLCCINGMRVCFPECVWSIGGSFYFAGRLQYVIHDSKNSTSRFEKDSWATAGERI